MHKNIVLLTLLLLIVNSSQLYAQLSNKQLTNYSIKQNTKSPNNISVVGIGAALSFNMGNYLISTNDGIMEINLVDGTDQLYSNNSVTYKHLRIKNQNIYLMDQANKRIDILDLNNEELSLLANNINNLDFVITNDRLIVAKNDYCGGHYIVFTTTGNTFESNNECENRWNSLNINNNSLLVSQNQEQTIRDVSAPSFSLVSINEGGYFFIKDIDNGYWVISNSGLFKKYDPAFNLIGTYSMGGISIKHISMREDGLFVAEEYNKIIAIRPDHNFKKEIPLYIYSANASGTFISGVIADEDNDGMPLWFETFYGLDPLSAADAVLDSDSDGVTNYNEFLNKTYPNNTDSDNDGLTDGEEITIGTDPLNPDSDNDGLTDGIEVEDLLSNPLSSDTDGDGIDDLTEFQLGLNLLVSNVGVDTDNDGIDDIDELSIGTSPINADSDSDGIIDGDELINSTDPLDPDSDDDNLNDGTEATLGTNPLVTDTDSDGIDDGVEVLTLNSNPLSDDSDSDLMPDGWEYLYSLDLLFDDSLLDLDLDGLSNINEFLYNGIPTDQDTDNDSLLDGQEFTMGTLIDNRDTDNDNMPDGWEFNNSTNILIYDSEDDNDSDGFTNGAEYWNKTNPSDVLSYPTSNKWSTYQGNNRHNGYQPTSIIDYVSTPINTIDMSALNPVQLKPATMNDAVIIAVYQNNLVAFDRLTEQELWRKVYQVNSTNPPALSDNTVYIQTGNHNNATHLRSYDAVTGQLNFQSPHSAQWESYLAPTIDGNNVYINGGSYGGAYAFDKMTGDQIWFSSAFAQFDMWTPSLDENYAYGYTRGNLIAVNKLTGLLEFSLNDPSYNWHGYSTNRAVILGGYDTAIVSDNQNNTGNITVFDRIAKELLWTKILDYQNQMVAANGILYTQSLSGVMYALAERSGDVLWNLTLPLGDTFRYNLIITNDHLIVSGINQTYFINTNTHEVDFTIPFSGDKELSEKQELLMTANTGLIKVYQLIDQLNDDSIFANSFE